MECSDKRIDQLWNQFQVVSRRDKQQCLSKEYVTKMVDYFVHTLHELGQTNNNQITQHLGEYFTCSICSDLFVNPVTLLCGHAYCNKCLKKRDQELYIELCIKCDKNSIRRTRWYICRRNLLDKYRTNVTVQSILKDAYPDELQAIASRLEGNKFFSDNDFGKAAQKYQESIKLCPNSFISWSNLSHVKASQKLYAEALEAAQQSLQICPTWAKGYYREGMAYKELSDELACCYSLFKYLIIEPSSHAITEKIVEILTQILDNGTSPPDKLINEERFKVFERTAKILLEKGLELCSMKNPYFTHIEERFNANISTSSLQSRLSCVLCCRIFYQATTTPCGHTFCASCLERSLDHNSTCAICRSPLTELINVKPKPIDLIVDFLARKYFPEEFEESRLASVNESSAIQYETDDIATIPVFVCMTAFPMLECNLHVFEPRYRLMIRRCLNSPDKMFGMCMYDEENKFKTYGVLLEIRDFKFLDDGRILVNMIGGKRFEVLQRDTRDGYSIARVKLFTDSKYKITEQLKELHKYTYKECETLLNSLPLMIKHTVRLNYGDLPVPLESENWELDSEHGPKWVWYMIRILAHTEDDKQAALKADSIQERLESVLNGIVEMKNSMLGNQ